MARSSRSRGSSSYDSDSDSSSSSGSSRSSGSRRSGASKRSTQTSVSRAPVKDDNWAVKLMKVAAGAPQGPCAVKKITFQVPYDYYDDEDDDYRSRYTEYSRYYFELAKFDDSISEIVPVRQRPGSRQSTSTKTHKRRRTRQFVERPMSPFEEPPFEQPYEPVYDPGYAAGFYPHPPAQAAMPPRQQWQHEQMPPPPPPVNMGGGGAPGAAPFIQMSGGMAGNFRDGWDDE